MGVANNTVVVYTSDNGPHMNSWRPAWPKITRYAVFAVESQVCSRHLMWAEQSDVLRRSMLAELAGRGLSAEYMDALLACATVNLPALNERRREIMDEAPG